MGNIDTLLTRANAHLQKQNFRNAYEDWQSARQIAQDTHSPFEDDGFERKYHLETARAIQESRETLDGLLKLPLDQFDETRADECLHIWGQAAGETDSELSVWRSRVNMRKQDLLESRIYEPVREEVIRLWEQAKDLRDKRNATDDELLTMYTRAYELARDKAAEHQKNPGLAGKLGTLAEEASHRRERFDEGAQNAKRSGALLRDYVTLFRFIVGMRPDQKEHFLDEYGAVMPEPMTKEQALEEARRQAKIYVNSQITVYLENARQSLEAAIPQPRVAEARLAERKQFDPLLEFVPDLYTRDMQSRIQKVEKDIAEAKRLLGDAEKEADRARELASSNPLTAHQVYLKARESYAGLQESEKDQLTRAAIQTALVGALRQHSATLQQQVEQKDYRAVIKSAEDVLGRYGNLKLMALEAELGEIRQKLDAARTMQQAVDAIATSLDQIERQSQADPERAAAALDVLERQYDSNTLRLAAHYERVRTAVGMRSNAARTLQDMRTYLTNPDRNRVEEQLKLAEKFASDMPQHRGAFDQLALQLRAYLALLDVERTLYQKGYDEAIRTLHAYENNEAVEPELRQKLTAKRKSLEGAEQTVRADEQMLKQAERLLKSNPPQVEDAYRMLTKIKQLRSREDSDRRDQLLIEARLKWIQEIQAWLRQLQIDRPFDLAELRQKMSDLETLDMDIAQRERDRAGIHETAQLARNETSQGLLDVALEHWKILEKRASLADLAHIQDAINALARRNWAQELEALIAETQQTQKDREAWYKGWTGRLNAMEAELAERASSTDIVASAKAKLDRVQYHAWRIRLLLVHAQVTEDTKTRRQRFDAAAVIAQDLTMLINGLAGNRRWTDEQNAILEEAELWANLGASAPVIGNALAAVESDLQVKVDLSLFSDAYYGWIESFTPYANYFPVLQSWFEIRFDALWRELITQLEAAQKDENNRLGPRSLDIYAKLFVLKPDDKIGGELPRKLAKAPGDLKSEVNQLKNKIDKQTALTGDDESNLLDQQIAALRAAQDHLKLIERVVERFRPLLLAARLGDEVRPLVSDSDLQLLVTTCSQLRAELEALLDQLGSFKQATEDLLNYLDGFDLYEDTNGEWEAFEEILEDARQSCLEAVHRIEPKLEEHPYMDAVDDRFSKSVSQFASLVNKLIALRKAFEQEHLEDAVAVIDQITGNREGTKADWSLLERQKALILNYTVSTGGNAFTNRTSIVGWSNVTAEVSQRTALLNTLVEWAEPMGAPRDLSTAALNGAPPPPLSTVVLWSEEREKALRTAAAGNFGRAIQIVQCALEGEHCDAPLVNKATLRTAYAQAGDPPLRASAEKPISFDEARARALTQRAARILSWVETFRYKIYEREIREAEQIIKDIEGWRKRWDQLEIDYAAVLSKLDDVLDRRFGWKGEVNSALCRAEDILNEMGKIAPAHPRLKNYLQDTTLQKAYQRLGRPKC